MILSKEISDTIKKDALNNIKKKNTVGEVNLYLYEEELPAKHILKAGPKDISIPKKTAFVFADKAPQYNWGHSCEYLSYDANTGDLYDKKEAEFPPLNFFTDPKKFEAFHTPVKQIDTLEAKKLTMKPIQAITYALTNAPGNRYAILFSGMSNNRHVNDIEFLYRTLIDIYGFDPANIYVLNQNGTIDYYGYPHPVGNWPGDNTPYRMVVNSQGTKNDFENVLSELALKIKSEDLLFIHTNNHGGHDGQQSNICCYPNWDTYTASDFSAKLHSLPQFKVLMVMMEQCHSGGFLNPIINNSPATWTHVAAACEEDKSSIGGANFDPFALDWIAGITGHYADSTGLSQEVDMNRDGRISAVEAFTYADAVHHPYDTPVSIDSPAGYGENIFLGTMESANIRIVSGVLLPKSGHQSNGKVTLTLQTNTVLSSDDATVNNACEWGGNFHYDKEPCKAVSIRAFDNEPKKIDLTDRFKNNFREVEISWVCSGGTIQEITYFFAGEE